MALLVIEACRRSLSPWMAVTISLSLVYLATSQWFPGVLNFKDDVADGTSPYKGHVKL